MADDSIPGSSSLRRFNDDDQATLRRSQRGRGSKRSRRSSTRSVEERVKYHLISLFCVLAEVILRLAVRAQSKNYESFYLLHSHYTLKSKLDISI